MEINTSVDESDVSRVKVGQPVSFTVDAYPEIRFNGRVTQIRNAPVVTENVVTYVVVVGVDNKDLRLKPGMTANVSIIVAQKNEVLKVPNAALRFMPPKSEEGEPRHSGVTPTKGGEGSRAVLAGAASMVSRTIWKQGDNGELVPIVVQTGISDGSWTEILSETVAEGDEVIVGIDQSRAGRKIGGLPPGFGTGGQRRSRDRGM